MDALLWHFIIESHKSYIVSSDVEEGHFVSEEVFADAIWNVEDAA